MATKTLLIIAACCALPCHAQSYTYWLSGSAGDAVTAHEAGLLLAGGGGDNDDAMRWMLERAAGGDVVVLRASGSDGYNPYFFTDLGVTVDSVETIRFDAPEAAEDAFVLDVIAGAEVLFLAGGSQTNYVDYWDGTSAAALFTELLHEKRITIGGTSAGMAVLGQAYYAPVGPGVISSEALGDPYHPYLDDVVTDAPLFDSPWLVNTITDTHYDQRDRHGRHVVFMALTAQASGARSFGIAANEYTAIAITPDGLAQVFGEYPQFDDYAYFLQTGCAGGHLPESIAPGQPLHWVRDDQALTVYRIPGRPNASGSLSLTDWRSGSGGEWWRWWVEEGVLNEQAGGEAPDCRQPGKPPEIAPLIDPSLLHGGSRGPGVSRPGVQERRQRGP